MSTMTLEQVRDRLREEVSALMQEERTVVTIHRTYLAAWADAIDAHLAQPAQAVDVVAIREVISQMSKEANGFDFVKSWRKRLTRAISGEKAGWWVGGRWSRLSQRRQ